VIGNAAYQQGALPTTSGSGLSLPQIPTRVSYPVYSPSLEKQAIWYY
jgi:hypothetical protein